MCRVSYALFSLLCVGMVGCAHNNEWDNHVGVQPLILSLYEYSVMIDDLAYPTFIEISNNCFTLCYQAISTAFSAYWSENELGARYYGVIC